MTSSFPLLGRTSRAYVLPLTLVEYGVSTYWQHEWHATVQTTDGPLSPMVHIQYICSKSGCDIVRGAFWVSLMYVLPDKDAGQCQSHSLCLPAGQVYNPWEPQKSLPILAAPGRICNLAMSC